MNVLVATKTLEVLEALKDRKGVNVLKALFTDQVYDAVGQAALVIIDFDDLVEHPYSTQMLSELLAKGAADKKLVYTSSGEFLARPDFWLEEAREIAGETEQLPKKRTVAFVSYSGGTGKTVLALDTAVHFARRTKMPVMLVEFTYGVSAISALTGQGGPFLYDLSTQIDVEPTRWRGVDLAPMDYENCRDLPPDQLSKYFEKRLAGYVLTVIDSLWPHGLLKAIEREVDHWFVIATPRLDAVENARKLREELGPEKASIIVNQAGRTDSLALAGVERVLDLPRITQVDRFEGQLGRQVLAQIYGPKNWQRYEPKRRFPFFG